ncbi:Rv3654c family TadE-like protein [Nocardioides mesophilus]|uniref:Flp pilus-assembly TadE/G-like family protein n=1 Tax=Nocardioides mesophilus TaxID=433659 RepID=A0A7G9RGE7_9ACTN|nr:Rv3654c family TadE-like protein [Nocardioides mesophilus]QNN54672.1 hypothetical protein H9L09_10430 [Nocardioides mesophilus]
MLGALLLVAVLLSVLGGLVVAQRRAQSAADLAALAGAVSVQRGQDACAAVAALVRRNDAELRSCTVAGREVQVVVALTVEAPAGRRLRVDADARAGPVDAVPALTAVP